MSDWTLHHGDCLEIMPTLAAGSVDAVICDPPYGTTSCKWDSVIPLAPMWAELKRVIKPRGAIVLFAAQPFTSALVMSNAEWFKYQWVWEKTIISGFLDANRRPLANFEEVLVFADGQTTYNPQHTKGDLHANGTRQREKFPDVYNGFKATTTTTTTTYFPRRILRMPNPRMEGQHPTQKPVDLLRYLVRTYTNAGQTVLDFTMGSGTTGVACVMEERNFIGIELERQYYDIADRRIREAAMQLPLLSVAD